MSNPTFDYQIRVRYDEADPMGFVHHANYFRYFELCRTEFLRACGGSYKNVEAAGEFVVVVKAEVRYRIPARYDDLLNVRVEITKFGGAKVTHEYVITRGEEVINEATLTLAVVDSAGKVQRIPEWMKWELQE